MIQRKAPEPSPPIPDADFNASTTTGRRVLVEWYGAREADSLGRRHFALSWNEDYSPTFGMVPQRRGQCFFANPSDHFVMDEGAEPDYLGPL